MKWPTGQEIETDIVGMNVPKECEYVVYWILQCKNRTNRREMRSKEKLALSYEINCHSPNC